LAGSSRRILSRISRTYSVKLSGCRSSVLCRLNPSSLWASSAPRRAVSFSSSKSRFAGEDWESAAARVMMAPRSSLNCCAMAPVRRPIVSIFSACSRARSRARSPVTSSAPIAPPPRWRHIACVLGGRQASGDRVVPIIVRPAAAQALGGERGVPVVFFGHLKVSNVKPSGGLVGLTLSHVEATVSAELSVELLSTKSGGTLWRSSATASEKVGGLSLVGGAPIFSAKDPNNAYGQLVNRLVYAVTYDLRSTWVKQ